LPFNVIKNYVWFWFKDEFVRERVRDYIAHDFKKYKSTRYV